MKSVMTHSFSRVPQAEIPRSTFDRSFGHKTTFDADKLVPIFCEDVIPGDTLNVRPTVFARLATPIYPLMDNMFLDIHWFSVPYRQLWDNFRKFMGEQVNPGDSTDYTIPQTTVTTGINTGTLEDYLGLPISKPLTYNALFRRAYQHIYNEWYRDQNLIDSETMLTGNVDATVTVGTSLKTRGKRHDYFTSCLPWLQKGDAVSAPLSGSADIVSKTGVESNQRFRLWNQDTDAFTDIVQDASSSNVSGLTANSSGTYQRLYWTDTGGQVVPNVEVDLSSATNATINELRQAFQIQKLLERDARSGTRYPEIVKAHYGVDFFDVTYRPEYLGGSSTPVNIHTVPATASESGATDVGDLSAFGTALADGGGFTKSFTEHCIVMGIASVRADLTYQQGLPRKFSRSTRYDHYFPVLAHLGEQSVLNKEIWYNNDANDDLVFGYQERWAEMRYAQSMVTGKFRSDATGSLDAWHLSQDFTSLPVLNETFITSNTPVDRVIQTPTEPHFIADMYFKVQHARPMPVFSVPGLIDHL